MQVAHEFGHALAAWLTGGRVQAVILHPLAISRTDVEPNPRPLVVAWGGPLLGAALPLANCALLVWLLPKWSWPARFFAGFCLLANGLYIGAGSLEGIGDAGDLLRLGAPRWSLWLFGAATAPAGLDLWNGIGRHFGLGPDAPSVRPSIACVSAACLMTTLIVEALLQ